MKQQRNTKQRKLILDTVRHIACHPSADAVFAEIHKAYPTVSRGTVYRNLNLLVDNGELIRINTQSACKYDHRLDRHDHIICSSCGRICDVPSSSKDNFSNELFSHTGYKILSKSTVYEGICPECQKALEEN